MVGKVFQERQFRLDLIGLVLDHNPVGQGFACGREMSRFPLDLKLSPEK